MSLRLASLLLAASLLSPARAEPIHDAARDFSFTPPPRFVDFPEGKIKPEVAWSFARGQPGDGDYAVLRIETLPGRIGREPLDRGAVERAATRGGQIPVAFEYRKIPWRGFELELVVMHLERDEQKVVIFATQVPLAQGAIQIFLSGMAEQERQLERDLAAVVGSLDGKASWLTARQRGERLGFGLGLPLAIGLVIAWRLRRRRA